MIKQMVSKIKSVGFAIARKTKSEFHRIKRLFVSPRLPRNPDSKILIHLGCGDINSREFINVDILLAPHVHYRCDVRDLSVFPDNYADLVYACHLLEHFPPDEIPKVVCEWKRILKLGGMLRISVPDFDKLIAMYQACFRDVESVNRPLMGWTRGYNPHCMIFNYKYLSRILCDLGFTSIREWDPDKVKYHDFEDWASRSVPYEGRQFHISLNVEATRRAK